MRRRNRTWLAYFPLCRYLVLEKLLALRRSFSPPVILLISLRVFVMNDRIVPRKARQLFCRKAREVSTRFVYLNFRVRVGAFEEEVLRLEVTVADVVLVVAVLDAAQDARHNHLQDKSQARLCGKEIAPPC